MKMACFITSLPDIVLRYPGDKKVPLLNDLTFCLK